jgi:CelD/BcsL family acetyltransferase involved in cellulose biosynthesis
MFRKSRTDKDAFMDDRMESYFRLLIKTLGQSGVLKLYALELNGTIAAMSLCFDFQGTVFLYNSCYDSKYKSLSVGTLCNVFSIRHSIEAGRKKFDFLKGDEPYKYHLGGYEVPLSRVRIRMSEEDNT